MSDQYQLECLQLNVHNAGTKMQQFCRNADKAATRTNFESFERAERELVMALVACQDAKMAAIALAEFEEGLRQGYTREAL